MINNLWKRYKWTINNKCRADTSIPLKMFSIRGSSVLLRNGIWLITASEPTITRYFNFKCWQITRLQWAPFAFHTTEIIINKFTIGTDEVRNLTWYDSIMNKHFSSLILNIEYIWILIRITVNRVPNARCTVDNIHSPKYQTNQFY